MRERLDCGEIRKMDAVFEVKAVSSLEKIFARHRCDAAPITECRGAGGEFAAFQLAMKSDLNWCVRIEAESELKPFIRLREVGLVPCDIPANAKDDFVLSSEPGYFPDPLCELADGDTIRLTLDNWHAVWVTVAIPPGFPAGKYPIRFHFSIPPMPCFPWETPTLDRDLEVAFEVLPYDLPPQKLLNINWFHADCIMEFYRTGAWTPRHWELLERYMRNMFEHGGNVLYTPLWPIPLDVAVGHRRPDCQLLTVTEREGRYRFDFTRLEQWLTLARGIGFRHFEMTHLFSQWGVKSAPRVIVNGESRFGWECAADAPEYAAFLRALLPELTALFDRLGLQGKVFFHISDEPPLKFLDNYLRAAALVRPLLGDYPVIDALSDVDFYRTGAIREPIPATPRFADFSALSLPRRWVYYCGDYERGVPNRQLGLPSMRNRVFGILAYAEKIDGFLQWGYNFWFSQNSLDWHPDVWRDPTCGRGFSGGGAFNVYPGPDGPVDSLHYEVFREGLQDLRVCQLLESRIGRDGVMALLQKDLEKPLALDCYPRSAEWLLAVRRRLDDALAQSGGK